MAQRKAAKPVEKKPTEIDGIPTAHGLTIMGRQYAQYDNRGFIRITDEGHRLLGRELRAEGRESIEKGTWHGITGKHPGPPEQPGYREVKPFLGNQRGRPRS